LTEKLAVKYQEKKYCPQGDDQEIIRKLDILEGPKLLRSKAKIQLDGTQAAVSDTPAA
jgi:hypothetical protein